MSFFNTFRDHWRDADSWRERANLIPITILAGILTLLVAPLMPDANECPACGFEYYGYADVCSECGYGFTELGELRNIRRELENSRENGGEQ